MKHGRLTYIKDLLKHSADNHVVSLWLCDCGNKRRIMKTRVVNGRTRSCGCLILENKHNLTHGMRYTKEYRTWSAIKNRCHNPKNKDYPRYGARGIIVHKSWRKNFMPFFNHIGYAPSPSHQIDRINTKRNYVPGNVRWATHSQQCRNRTTSYIWYIKGKKFQTITEAAAYFKVTIQSVHKWVRGYHDHRRGTFTPPRYNCYTKKRYTEKSA